MKGTVAIIGSDGQLGQSIKYILGLREMDFLFEYNYVFLSHNDIDVTKEGSIKDTLSKIEDLKFVVNCAAYTNVEKAEEEETKCHNVNANGVYFLGKYCKEHDVYLITIGTDYMYNPLFAIPVRETTVPSPLNRYGNSKYEGITLLNEMWRNNQNPQYLVINTSWLYSEFGNNFVKKIVEKLINKEDCRVVIDQVGSPTYAPNLAHFIIDLVEGGIEKFNNENCRIINCCGDGIASWYDIAKFIEYTIYDGLFNELVTPIFTLHIYQKARRPNYSALSIMEINKKFGNTYTPYWMEDVRKCVKNIMKA